MMLLSNEKLNFSNSGESSTSMDEQLLENVKPNLISLTSSGSYSSHFYSGQVNAQNVMELQNEETSLDSFTVILEEPEKDSESKRKFFAADSLLHNDIIEDVCVSPETDSKHSATTPDVLDVVSVDQNNVEQTETRRHRYLKRMWSSVQDLSNVSYSSQKNESEFTHLIHNPCQSSTTISSVPKSKDSGLPRSLSCLSFGSGVKPYDHIQSKVREYISHIKNVETQRKKNVEVCRKKNDSGESPVCSMQQESDEDLRHVIQRLQKELGDKNNIISQIQENYDVLLMKYADAENRIDRLRFKVLDSSVEEIRSQRTQDDFTIWSDIRNRSPQINQPQCSRSGSHSNHPFFKRSLFQNSLSSGSKSMPSTANIRQENEENMTRTFQNEVNTSQMAEHNFSMSIKKVQEKIAFPPLAISTPNHSFNQNAVPKEIAAGIEYINSEKSVDDESQEGEISLDCTGNFLVRSEEDIFSSDDICLQPHTSENISLNSCENLVGESNVVQESDTFKVISDNLRQTNMPSFLKDFSLNEDYKTTSSETSILKVKQWQDSLPPLEQREPSCYDVPTSNSNRSKRGILLVDHPAKEKRKSYNPSDTCNTLEGKKHSLKVSQKENLCNPISKDISTPYLEKTKGCKFGGISFTKRPFWKCLIKKFNAGHIHCSKSEPDLRLLTCESFDHLEVKGDYKHIKTPNQVTQGNSSQQKLQFIQDMSCKIGPLQIEPCYCWDKGMLDLQSKLPPKLNSTYILENSVSECAIPHLKLDDLTDPNKGSFLKNMRAGNIHNANMPSFTYSPSTSVSSTAVFSGCKNDTTEKNLIPLEDSSTSYKSIQRNLANKITCTNCPIGKQHDALCNTLYNASSKVNCHGCRNCLVCHNCKPTEDFNHSARTKNYVGNYLCYKCSNQVVPKHSCGVNTDNGSMVPPSSSGQLLTATTFYCSCCVNKETADLVRHSSHHIDFFYNGGVRYQGNTCQESLNHIVLSNKTQNGISKHSTSTESEHARANQSNEQSLSVPTTATEMDIRELSKCLEEVNTIANLLKAQSESIIQVVTENLADCLEKGDTVINVPDLTKDYR